MNDAEKKFSAENGMSSAEAWNFVLQWKLENKLQEAKNGCEEIIRFFPDHQEARQMLRKIVEEEGGLLPSTIETSTHSPQKNKWGVEKFFDKMGVVQEPLPGMQSPSKEERFIGMLCYLYIFVIIPLFLKRESNFVQFHAWQGLVLTVVVFIFFNIIAQFFYLMYLGDIIRLLGLFVFLFYLYSMYSAFRGKWTKIPILYEFSEKLRRLF